MRRTLGAAVASLAVALLVTTPSAAVPPAAPPTTAATMPSAADDPTDGTPPTDRGAYGTAEAPVPGEAPAAATDRVLVRFAPTSSTTQRGSALRAAGAGAGEPVRGTDFVAVPVGGDDPATVVAALDADPRVQEVQLDHARQVTAWPNDEAVPWVWPYVDLARLPRAWDASTGQAVVVAVLDSGVNAGHPDLAGSVLAGTDLVDHDADPADPHGHGTAMAGLVAAHANNSIGSAGAAYGAKVLPVRVLDAQGQGNDSTIAAGIAWAVAHGADVVNLSLAGPAASPVLLDAIWSAVSAGVVVVAAAGNAGTDVPQYPAAYAPILDGMLAVGATDDVGARADFSSRGDWVTVAAPGVDLVTTHRAGGYVATSGTSGATALVSGVAALVVGRTLSASPAEVESRTVRTARDAGPRGADPFYGAGVVDAAGAVTAGEAERAAVAVPLDRLPTDASTSDDSPARAQGMSSSLTARGTLSPEGDQDWYRVTVPSTDLWRVRVEPLNYGPIEDRSAPSVEVRDSAGTVRGARVAGGRGGIASVDVKPLADGVLLVGVRDAKGGTSRMVYDVVVHVVPPFGVGMQFSTGGSEALGLGDVTGDGLDDAILPVPNVGVRVQRGWPNGSFALPVVVGSPTTTGKGVAVLDADRDGDTDVVVSTTAGVHLLLQQAGALVDGGTVVLPGGGFTLAAGDLEGDGDTDVVATTSSGPTAMLTNDGAGHLAVATTVSTSRSTVRLGDLTGDGRAEIIGPDGWSHQQPDGTFGPWTAFALPPDVAPVRSSAVADLTGDGRADVVLSANDGRIVVIPQTAAGTLGSATARGGTGIPGGALELADFDGDGRTDVLATSDYDRLSLLLQAGDGTLRTPWWLHTPFQSPSPADGVRSADLDRDGCRDVVLLGRSLLELRGLCERSTGQAGWLADVAPAPHTSGVAVRPTVTASFVRALDASTVNASTVRLREGTSGTAVATSVTYDAGSKTVRVTPTADLSRGSHYELVVDGVTDVGGARLAEPVRTWFTVAAGADRFTPLEPFRVADSRGGEIIRSGEVAELSFAELVPPEATAVVLNVTSTQATSQGNVRVYPAGVAALPRVSNLNVVARVDQPNLVTVALGTGQAVNLLTEATDSHLVVDLCGYYSPGGATAFEPVSPVRVMDTRSGAGAVPVEPLRGGRWVDLALAGTAGMTPDATAVVLNVTGTNVTGPTHVRVYPTPGAAEDQTPPDVSNLNLDRGRDQPNLVTVRLGDSGRVRFFMPVEAADVVADLVGYYSATGDNGFVPLEPARAVDTRSGQGVGATLGAGVPSTAVLAGVDGVPTDATAVVLNVTGVHPSGVTHVRVFPTTDPATLPDVSSLNLVPGRDEANLTIVGPGVGGRVSFYTHTAATDLVVDVSGYFRR